MWCGGRGGRLGLGGTLLSAFWRRKYIRWILEGWVWPSQATVEGGGRERARKTSEWVWGCGGDCKKNKPIRDKATELGRDPWWMPHGSWWSLGFILMAEENPLTQRFSAGEWWSDTCLGKAPSSRVQRGLEGCNAVEDRPRLPALAAQVRQGVASVGSNHSVDGEERMILRDIKKVQLSRLCHQGMSRSDFCSTHRTFWTEWILLLKGGRVPLGAHSNKLVNCAFQSTPLLIFSVCLL